MAMASISIHGVRGIHTEIHPLDPAETVAPVFVRKLVITNRDGERLEFTLFAEDTRALEVKHVPDADGRSLELALAIKDTAEVVL